MAIGKTLSNAAASILYTDRRDFYLSPRQTKELWTDATPFTTIISNRAMESVPDPDYKMFEHRSGWVRQSFQSTGTGTWTTSGAAVPGETLGSDASLVVDNPVGLTSTAAGDASLIGLECEVWDSTLTTYRGVVVVTDFSSGVKLKALGNPRSATNVMANIADNDYFVVIGSAFSEGSTSPDAYSDDIVVVYNSSQIFRTPVEVTGTLYHQTKLRGYSDELARLRKEKNFEHKMQKERAFLFGVRIGGTGSKDLANDNATNLDSFAGEAAATPRRSTMGIVPALYRYGASSGDSQNLFTIASATYKYSNFVDDMEKVFQYQPMGGAEKVALCGAGALSYWSKVDATSGFVKNSGFSVTIDSRERSSLGFNFRRLETPHGNLLLVAAPALRGKEYKNSMLIITPENLALKQYRPMKYSTNIKTENGYDGVKDEYFSDEGVAIQLIESHSLFTIV